MRVVAIVPLPPIWGSVSHTPPFFKPTAHDLQLSPDIFGDAGLKHYSFYVYTFITIQTDDSGLRLEGKKKGTFLYSAVSSPYCRVTAVVKLV